MSQNPGSSQPEPSQGQQQPAPSYQPMGGFEYQPTPPPQPKRRGTSRILIAVIAIIGVCLLACVGALIWWYTQLGPEIRESAREYTSTQVALHATPTGQSYTVMAEDLERGINQEIQQEGDAAFDDVIVELSPQGYRVSLDLQEQDVYYTGSFSVVDGRIEVTNADADAPVISFIFGADDMAQAVEEGINDYFEAQGLRVVSVEQQQGRVVFITEPAT